MPEIQIIPQAPSSFMQGTQAAGAIGNAYLTALQAKKQLETESLQNAALTQQLQQAQDQAPIQKALLQAHVDNIQQSTAASKAGVKLSADEFDFSKMSEDRKFTLAQTLGKSQVDQTTEGIADMRSQRIQREKMYPTAVQSALADLNFTQARTQGLQADTQQKAQALAQHQQEIDQQAKQSDILSRVHVLNQYEQATTNQRIAMKKDSTIGGIVQNMPTDQEDVTKAINEQLAEAVRSNPEIGGPLLAARIIQMQGKPDQAQVMTDLMGQLNSKFQGDTRYGKLAKGMTQFLQNKNQSTATTKPSGQPTASVGTPDTGTDLQDENYTPSATAQVVPGKAAAPASGLDTTKLNKYVKVAQDVLNTSVSEDYASAPDMVKDATGGRVPARQGVTVQSKPLLDEAFQQIKSSKTPTLALSQFESQYAKYLSDKDMAYLANLLVKNGIVTPPTK